MKYLKSYNQKKLTGYFTDGRTIYELQVLDISFFGLIKKKRVVDYTVGFNENDSYFKGHWDELILSQKPLKNNTFSILGIVCIVFILLILFPIFYIINFLYKLLTH